MVRFNRNTPPPAPPREISAKTVVFDPVPQEERRPQPIDLDDVINKEMKFEVAKAAILKDYHRLRPLKFKQICSTIGVDELDLQDWIQEILKCT